MVTNQHSTNKRPEKRISWEEPVTKKIHQENNWISIHPAFTNQSLIRKWTNQHFTFNQAQEWAAVFTSQFNPHEIVFYCWLRDSKQLTPQQCLDYYYNLEFLREEYQGQQQLLAHIELN